MSKVIILDFGSQVTQLIARRVREAGVYSEIHPCVTSAEAVAAMHPDAIILSGGPASVGEKDAPRLDKGLLELGVPVLGICYGMQLLAHELGGVLAQSETLEYGPADFEKVFREAYASEAPAVIDCAIDPDEFVLPMLPPGGSIDDIIVEKGAES